MKQFTLMIIVLLSTSWMGGCTSTKTSDGASYGPAAFSQPAFTAVTVAYAPEMQGILNRIEQDPNASIHTTTTSMNIMLAILQRGMPLRAHRPSMIDAGPSTGSHEHTTT